MPGMRRGLDCAEVAPPRLGLRTHRGELRPPHLGMCRLRAPRAPGRGGADPDPGGSYHGKLYKFSEKYDVQLGQEWEDALKRIEADA